VPLVVVVNTVVEVNDVVVLLTAEVVEVCAVTLIEAAVQLLHVAGHKSVDTE